MRLRRLRWSAACFCLVAVACGDDGPTGPQPVVLTVISGDAQPGKAGRQLDEPFVVRVTDRRGRGVRGVLVTWTITPGGGAFGDDTSLTTEGVFDDAFGTLDEGGCPPVPAQTVRSTDPDGIARVRFMPTWFGPVTVTARAPGASDPVTFTTDASDPLAGLTIVGENHHEGFVGPDWDEHLGGLIIWSRQLFVRLIDGQQNPVPHVPVRWGMTSGDAEMLELQGCSPDNTPLANWTRTGSGGFAGVQFRLTAVGTSTVAAAVPGVLVSPVTFTVTATHVGIVLAGPEPTFLGPDFSSDLPDQLTSDVMVPVGAPVEWVSGLETARITSTSAPPGGASFDSGELSRGERFEFVPDVAGTWEYVDQVSGATGTLTAH